MQVKVDLCNEATWIFYMMRYSISFPWDNVSFNVGLDTSSAEKSAEKSVEIVEYRENNKNHLRLINLHGSELERQESKLV